ncbi:NTP transferase domain-containing protein [Candidatus Gracilibacteria bacterium]|nr:NTP transferase domain-containing protein [Candidatus Gracilibacteria bacterium]
MKTIFLASGRSTRMEPLGDKNLLEFCGKPLILHLLENAKKGGAKNFIVVVNKNNKKEIATLLQKAKIATEIKEQRNLDEGMAGGVLDGLGLVSYNESVLVLGGNDYFDAEVLKKIIEQGQKHDGAILAKELQNYFPGGYLQVCCKNFITSIIEKPGEGNEPSKLVNIVAHYFSRAGDLHEALGKAKSNKDDVYEVALSLLLKTKKFVAVPYKGVWQAVKYPWHVLELMEIVLASQKTKISKKAQIAKSAKLNGLGIVVEDGARIFDNAVVQGPCYVGKNAVVGNNALVRNSIIGENSVAGYNTEIARSFLARNVTTHIAYVGDSVIDEGVNFGAFSCTANLRLDKKTVRVKIKEERIDSHHEKLGAIVGGGAQIGIHAMLMPGAKIDADDFVEPGQIKK